jgi:uncharacterized protein YaiL (DUF2058 family)
VRIDGLGLPIIPAITPANTPAQTANTQAFNASANAAALALQEQELLLHGGGGGGGGGHHGGVKKAALESIDDIAARASLNIERRKKTMLDRQRDIERMQAEMAADGQQVGEKDGGSEDQREKPADEEQPQG